MDLFEQWRDVKQEAIQLSEAIERIPEECACGDAEAHLEERCACCDRHPGASKAAGGDRCSVILERLNADLSVLCENFSRAVGALPAAARGRRRLELRRGVFLAASNLKQLTQALERVNDAVVGFRRTCTLLEMRKLKSRIKEFREHCNRLDVEIRLE